MKINFRKWLETEEEREGIKDSVLNFLRDKLNLTNDEDIMSMKVSSVNKSIINQLLKLGVFDEAAGDLLTDVKNGNITFRQIVDRLAGLSTDDNIEINEPTATDLNY